MKKYCLDKFNFSVVLMRLLEKIKAADKQDMSIQITQEEHEALRACVRIKKKKPSKKKGTL